MGIRGAVVRYELVSPHDEVEAYPGRVVGYAVVLYAVFEAVLAVGDAAYLLPHPALGVVHELLVGLVDEVDAVPVQQVFQALLCNVERPYHGVEVAPSMGRSAVVGEDHLPDIFGILAPAHDFDQRKAQSLLVDLGGGGGERSRRHASDLGDVPDVRNEAEDLSFVVDGLDHGVLRHVAATAVRVVVNNDVARLEVLQPVLLDGPLDGVEDCPELGWAELRLRDHVAVAVEDHAREVEALVEDGRVGGLHHGDTHLAADVDQLVVEYAQRDLVYGGSVVRHVLPPTRLRKNTPRPSFGRSPFRKIERDYI